MAQGSITYKHEQLRREAAIEGQTIPRFSIYTGGVAIGVLLLGATLLWSQTYGDFFSKPNINWGLKSNSAANKIEVQAAPSYAAAATPIFSDDFNAGTLDLNKWRLGMSPIYNLSSTALLIGASAAPSVAHAQTQGKVLVLVATPALQSAIQSSLVTYQTDLQNEGYTSEVIAGPWSSPHQVRALIQSKQTGLTGTVLIGDIPLLRFNDDADYQGDPYWHDYPSAMYFMDLNGVWSDSDNNGVYETWEGNLAPEIWVTQLKASNLPLLGDEVSILRNYFTKNHQYRTGQFTVPNRALTVYHNIDIIRSQEEHGGWGASPGLIYSNSSVKGPSTANLSEDPGSPVVLQARADWIAGLQDPSGYELMALNTITFSNYHAFGNPFSNPNNLFSTEVAAIGPKRAVWFHLLTSEPGLHWDENYLAGIYLFDSPTAMAVYAGTQHSGVAAFRPLYESLAAHQTFGDALLASVRYTLSNLGNAYIEYAAWAPNHEETWYHTQKIAATVLFGDGSLTRFNDVTTPTVSITSPASGATVSGTITVQASATDNVGVVGVQFKLDGSNLGSEDTAAPYEMSWNTNLATNGAHTLTAVARDAAGNVNTSATVSITVSNISSLPSLSINDVTVTEENSGTVNAPFAVALSSASGQVVSVNYTIANVTATAGSDYVSGSGTVTFPAGSTTQTITVAVNSDLFDEPNETFLVNLSNATNATIADNQGQGTITDNDAAPLPERFVLLPNYPNPFNAETGIAYQLPERSLVKLVLRDLMGRELKILANEEQEAGTHEVRWDGRDARGNPLPSGIYIYSLHADHFRSSKKLLLIK